MFEFINEEDERGQVGIGTLIVFIAMVLVAAIAAGVLINTAGVLQTQAESTGDQAQSQVSDRIQVQSASGEVAEVGLNSSDTVVWKNTSESTDPNQGRAIAENITSVNTVNLTVTKSPGANNIDLTEVTAELITNDGVTTQVLEASNLSVITAESDGDKVITDSGDRYTITFEGYGDQASAVSDGTDTYVPPSPGPAAPASPIAEADWDGVLEGGDSMEIRLSTAAGATTVEEVVVPDSLVERDAVSL